MKITALETIHLPDYPSILFVAVHTDAGLTGYADTCYMPDAVAGLHPPVRRADAPRPRPARHRTALAAAVRGHRPHRREGGRAARPLGHRRLPLGHPRPGRGDAGLAGARRRGARPHPHLQHLRRARATAAPRRAAPATAPTAHDREVRRPDRLHGARRRTGPRSARRRPHRHEDLAVRLRRALPRRLGQLAIVPRHVRPDHPLARRARHLAPPTSTARWSRSARSARPSATGWRSWSRGTASGRCRRR